MQDDQFRLLLNHFDLSWPGYRRVRKGVKKRLGRHLQSLGCGNMKEYLRLIDSNSEVRRQAEQYLTVSISRFFRDRSVWTFLEHCLLPEMLGSEVHTFRVWSAGCASGEEPYSFSIIWDRLRRAGKDLPSLELLGTDKNRGHLERAKAGIFNASSLKEVTEDIRRSSFEELPGKRRYRLIARLREQPTWMIHDLLKQPPASGFAMIFLRNNLLTYYTEPIIRNALGKITGCLQPGGILVVGVKEKPPRDFLDLEPVIPVSCILRKKCGR